MVANPERRLAVCDAALGLLGREGSHAVTHRAVDAEAGIPQGTTSNYFPSRSSLFVGMAQRMLKVLAPDEDRLAALASLPADDAAPAYVGYVVERLLAQPNLARAWFDLRLEAVRSPEIAAVVEPVLRDGFAADVAFSAERGLPGGAERVRLLHCLVDGLVFDALTVPLEPGSDPLTDAQRASRWIMTDDDVSRDGRVVARRLVANDQTGVNPKQSSAVARLP